MGLLLLFFDGIGVGRDDPAENPFAEIDPGWLAPVAGRAPVDGTGFNLPVGRKPGASEHRVPEPSG